MTKGVWNGPDGMARRSAAARKGAAARKACAAKRMRDALNGGKPILSARAIDKLRGSEVDRVLDGASISSILDRVKRAAAAQREE